MSLESIYRALDRAVQYEQLGDYPAAADELLTAAERANQLAGETRDPVWQEHLEVMADEYLLLAREHQMRKRETRGAGPPSAPGGGPARSGPARSPNPTRPTDELRTDWKLAERPSITLADVAGMDELKALVRRQVIEPLRSAEVYDAFKIPRGYGVLLYGPPGTGKTFIAKALAGELDCAFFVLDAGEVVSKWVGDTEKNLKALMAQAKSEQRSIVYIDEVSELFPARGSGSTIADRSVSQFLSELDGLQPRENWMLVIGATNYPTRVDSALYRSGRLGHHIYVGPPDVAARAAILRLEMRSVPQDDDLDFTALGVRTDGYSAADVSRVAQEARWRAAERTVQLREGRQYPPGTGPMAAVNMGDFDDALTRVRPSPVDPKMLRMLDEFRREHEAV